MNNRTRQNTTMPAGPMGDSRNLALGHAGMPAVTARAFRVNPVERFGEIVLSLPVVLAAFLPVALVLWVRRLLGGAPVFQVRTIRGGGGVPVQVSKFNIGSGMLANLPLFVEMFRGRLALVGIEPEAYHQNGGYGQEQDELDQVRPGLVTLWGVRRDSRIAHQGKLAIQLEYVRNKGLVYDFLLLLRAFSLKLYSGSAVSATSPLLNLFGLNVANLTMSQAITAMQTRIRQKRQSTVFFVNPDCCNKMYEDREYFGILEESDYVFPDGVGLLIAGKLLGTPMRENINGTDMLPFLCELARREGQSLFLLGGKPGVAETMAARITEAYGVMVAGTGHGYFDHERSSAEVIAAINESGAGMLLVAFGAPLQEKWLSRHRKELRPLMLFGVGGLFDFYSGRIRRAPVWVREMGFEWVFRMLMEPGRMWKRYVLGNPLFLFRVLAWKYKLIKRGGQCHAGR